MESETGIVLGVFEVVLLALGIYIYILASGSNQVFPIIQQIWDSSVGQAVRTIIPDATATCQKINIEASRQFLDRNWIGIILPPTRRSFAQNEISNDLGDTIRGSVNNLGKDLSNSIIGMVDKQMKSFCKGEGDSSGSVQTTISKGDGSSQSVMSSQGSGSGSSQSVMSSQNNGEGRTIISSGGSGNGKLCGGSGDDVLRGDSGDDTIYGGAGNDIIYGEDGDDKLYGGPGNDKLYGGPGDDILKGGLGADHFDCGPGKDTITDFNPSEGDTKTDDCERVVKAE